MNQNFNSFFENPTLFGLIAIFIIVASPILIMYMNNRNGKKIRDDNKANKHNTEISMQKMLGEIQILKDRNKNSLDAQATEDVVTAVLRSAENGVKKVIMKVFYHNHRDNKRRQTIIDKNIRSAVITVYENAVNSLMVLRYKEQKLSEPLANFDKEELINGLLQTIFNKGDSDARDLEDTLAFTTSFFTSVITNAKSYYSNL